jgi:hypothetical protein
VREEGFHLAGLLERLRICSFPSTRGAATDEQMARGSFQQEVERRIQELVPASMREDWSVGPELPSQAHVDVSVVYRVAFGSSISPLQPGPLPDDARRLSSEALLRATLSELHASKQRELGTRLERWVLEKAEAYDARLEAKTCLGTMPRHGYQLPCPSCDGDQQLRCLACFGAGKRPCSDCDGEQGRPCPQCADKDTPGCPRCSGGRVACWRCGATGSVRCADCETLGRVKCGPCGGTHPDSFKKDAVRRPMARGSKTVAELAEELGVCASILHRWRARSRPKSAAPPPNVTRESARRSSNCAASR